MSEHGEDPAFSRGSNRYNNFRGDMDHKPNPNLAPVGKGPYYAAKIQMGDLGTFPESASTGTREATTAEGTAIPGLLAVGAAAVSVFGGGYPGYGSHIGPALVFGYRAGRDVAMLARCQGCGPRSHRGSRLGRRAGGTAARRKAASVSTVPCALDAPHASNRHGTVEAAVGRHFVERRWEV